MSGFKDFDLDLNKINKSKDSSNQITTVTLSNCTCGQICDQTFNVCTTIAYPCKTIATCEGVTCNTGASCGCSINCSPTDMGMCDIKNDYNNDSKNLRRC
ncbi:FDLD family class I lanthipeptide [Peptoniphilus harei]|uniref:FDLD family class I lanthipeptide n=1 Tax=Peptoniphilus harei TaxID=54005 RepID=A0A943SS10_9FIRM|nr:FDLD family class I lanthipeptide [Peptoniphilus harei]MBS6535737.1 FDLD family class I lanthipeptide [Peptoniphilus harei]